MRIFLLSKVMTMMIKKPRRGEVWWVDLNPVVGHEQAKHRPCLVISVDEVNASRCGVLVVVPLTTKEKNLVWQVPAAWQRASSRVQQTASFILVQHLRAVSILRFGNEVIGVVDDATLRTVETLMLRLLMPVQ